MGEEAPGISGPLVDDDTVLYRLHSVPVAREMRSVKVLAK